MLDYTKAAIKKTVADFKLFLYAVGVVTQLISVGYLVYTLCTGVGVLVANVAMLAVSVAYLVFFLCVTEFGKSPDGKKQLKRAVKEIFSWCKRLIKLYTLGVTLYGLYVTTQNVSWLSVILSAFMVVGWVLEVVFHVVFRIVEFRVKFLIDGLEADVAQLLQPVKTVGNFFKKIAGKEVEPEKPQTKNQQVLQQLVDEEKTRKKQEKQSRKKQRKPSEQSKEIAVTDDER